MIFVPPVMGKASAGPVMNVRPNVIAVFVFIVVAAAGLATSIARSNPLYFIGSLIVAAILSMSPKIAKQWEKAIVLRLGKYVGTRGPGLFWIVPLIDTVSMYIDQRILTTSFAAEQTLTSDT